MNNYKLIICPSLVDMNRLCGSVSGGVQWRQCGISGSLPLYNIVMAINYRGRQCKGMSLCMCTNYTDI